MKPNPAIERDYHYRRLVTSPYHKMAMDMLDAYLKHLSAAKKTIPDDDEFRKLYNRFLKFVLTASVKKSLHKKAGLNPANFEERRLVRSLLRSGLRTAEIQLELNDAEKIQRLIKKMTRQDTNPISERVELALQLLERVLPDDLASHPITVIHDFEMLFKATERWIPDNRSSVTSDLPEITVQKNPDSGNGFEKTGQRPKSGQSRST